MSVLESRLPAAPSLGALHHARRCGRPRARRARAIALAAWLVVPASLVASSPAAGDPQAGETQAGETQAGDPQAGDPQAGDPQAGGAHTPTFEAARDLHVAGKRRQAREAYLAFLASAPPAALEARARNNLCLLLGDLGELDASLVHCRRAVELRRGDEDTERLARALNNEGIALLYTGRPQAARQRFEEALDLNRRQGRAAAEVDNLVNLGLVLDQEGRFDPALEHYRQAEARIDRALADGQADRAWGRGRLDSIRINQGVVLEKLGQYQTALDLYRRLLEGEGVDDDRAAASLRVNMAVLYRNLGDPVRAESMLVSAVELFRDLGDPAGMALAELNLGTVRHRNLGRSREAEADYRSALAHARQAGDRPAQIAASYLLGRLELDWGRASEARSSFEEALAEATASRSVEGIWSAHHGLARVAEHHGELDRAFDHARQAMDAVESVRSGLEDDRRRGGFFSPKRPIYESAVEILWRRFRAAADTVDAGQSTARTWAEEALQVVLRAKQRALLDRLGIDPVSTSADPRTAPFDLDRRFDLDQIGARLDGRTQLEYFFGRDALYAFRLDSTGVAFDRLAPRRQVIEHVHRVRRGLELASRAGAAIDDPAGGSAIEPGSDDGSSARALGRILARPLAFSPGREPGRGSSEKELILAPDLDLRLLPFELLPVVGESSAAAATERWVDSLTLTYVPSAAWWLGRADARTTPGPAGPAHGFVGYGNPVPSAAARAWLGADLRLEPLVASTRELRSARDRVPGRAIVRTGPEATERALVDDLSGGARVLHLAAHSVIDPRRGAALFLSGPGEGGGSPADDGLLRPEEIADLRADLGLAVLASCHSSLGEQADVGALGSLAGAFLAAGAEGVVASLWEVGDAHTAVFMDQLYHRLGRGERPDRALAEVKRLLRDDERWNEPHLWAGWILWGDPAALAAGRGGGLLDGSGARTRLAFGLLGLGLLALGWLISRRPPRDPGHPR